MLSPLDETLLHQVAETFDNTPVSDHRFFDRTWIGMHSPDGALAVMSSFGVYKNNNVMDGYLCIQENAERQYNHRFSRRLRPNIDGMSLGPLSVEILEPFKRLRLRLKPGSYAGSCDIEWVAALPPHEEPKHRTSTNGRVVTDHIRFDQLANCSGWIEIDGRRTEFENWFGARDHSWGVRPGVGGFETTNDDPGAEGGLMAVYCWWLTEEAGGLLQLQEDGQGNRRYLDGFISYRGVPEKSGLQVVDIKHDFEIIPGTRLFQRGRIVATTADGQRFEIEAENVGRPWLYKGSGYDNGYNDEKGLGVWRGDWLEEYDVYDISDVEACVLPDGRVIRPRHREQLAKVTVNGKPGFAHLPFISMGHVERYPFRP